MGVPGGRKGKKQKGSSAEEKEMAKYGRGGARGRAKASLEKNKERPSIEEVVKKKLENVAEEKKEQVKRDVVTTEIIGRTQSRDARFVDLLTCRKIFTDALQESTTAG